MIGIIGALRLDDKDRLEEYKDLGDLRDKIRLEKEIGSSELMEMARLRTVRFKYDP